MSKVKIILLFVTICFVSMSCKIAEKIINPVKKEQKEIVKKIYEKNGLSFSYPSNWQVTADEILEEGVRNVNIEDSDSSLFIITMFPSEFSVDLDEHAESFKKNLPSNIPVGKLSEAKTTITSRIINDQNYKGVRQRYSISLLGEVIPHTVDFFLVNGEKFNVVLTIQAPDEDWKAAEKEFQVISDSLKFE